MVTREPALPIVGFQLLTFTVGPFFYAISVDFSFYCVMFEYILFYNFRQVSEEVSAEDTADSEVAADSADTVVGSEVDSAGDADSADTVADSAEVADSVDTVVDSAVDADLADTAADSEVDSAEGADSADTVADSAVAVVSAADLEVSTHLL
jgi:hypothetical protein